MITANDQITLAIESAINGGSLALFRGDELIEEIAGATGVSRAEDLLPNIDAMLNRNGLRPTNLIRLIAGAGPGSFTGIRIGLATAMGLAAAVNAELRSVSTLEAMAHAASATVPLTCALPVGRDTVCMQSFDGRLSPASPPLPIAMSEFAALVSRSPQTRYVVNSSLAASLFPDKPGNITDIGDGLASHIGRFADCLTDSPPLFIGKNNR
jgi:tRNA threonylcarbamoyl adenosine modification protein YeaZ